MMKIIKILLIVFTLSILYNLEIHASIINAKSCSHSDVQAAIDSAITGDTVIVPSGNCTWSTTITIPNGKKIILKGAGIDSTVITQNPYGTAVNLYQSGSRVTGFSFNEGYIQVDGDNWRIDHCEFYRASAFGGGVNVRGDRENYHPTGLVDHCVFYNSRVLVYGWAGIHAHRLWSQPLNLGSGNNVVYIEDCKFTCTVHSNAVDGNCGARFVFRYNIVNDTELGAHSVQGDNRAVMKWEIYNNTINQVNRTLWVPMFIRGGTGVVFNNTITGAWGNPSIALDNVRSCFTKPVSLMCDGNSPWDGNQEEGYPCRDQIGRSTDQSLWTSENPYPSQVHEPAYAWNNKYGSNDLIFSQVGCEKNAAHIKQNRDYFNNIQKPDYTPYTYPHPMIKIWDDLLTTALSAPENLRITKITE